MRAQKLLGEILASCVALIGSSAQFQKFQMASGAILNFWLLLVTFWGYHGSLFGLLRASSDFVELRRRRFLNHCDIGGMDRFPQSRCEF
jgi:hypothetical protein